MTRRYNNVSDVPLALAVFLATDSYDYNDDPYTISATTLLKPVRQIVLAERMPKDVGLPVLLDQTSNRLGASIHDGIERAWKTNYKQAMLNLGYPQRVIDRVLVNPTDEEVKNNPDAILVYLEQRLTKQVGKWTVTGKFDFIGDGRVQDFKTASVWSYMNQVNADKQSWQGSLYRWLDPKKIHQDQMDIHHIFMDWRQAQANADPKYPQRRIMKQVFNLYSLAETDFFVRQKLDQIEEYRKANEPDIPPCDDDALWRSEPKFKYYKNGDVTSKRSTKNFDSMHDARQFMIVEQGGAGAIKEVPGEVKACHHCKAFDICSQKDILAAKGDLIL